MTLVKIEYKVRFARQRIGNAWEKGWRFKIDAAERVEGFVWWVRFWDPELDRGLWRLMDRKQWSSNRRAIQLARKRGETEIIT